MDTVVLVYPYFFTAAPQKTLFPPLGIAALASQLKALGIDCVQYDCTFKTFSRAVADLAARRPALVGFYVMATLSRRAFALLAALKPLLPRTLFAAGGPLPTLYPERFAKVFDIVFRGEADLIFPEFARAFLAAGGKKEFLSEADARAWPGSYFTRDGEAAGSPPVHHDEAFIDSLPFPDRAGVDYRRYQRL